MFFEGTMKIGSLSDSGVKFENRISEIAENLKKFTQHSKRPTQNPFRGPRYWYPSEICAWEIVNEKGQWILRWDGRVDFVESARWISYIENFFLDKNDLYLEGGIKINDRFGDSEVNRSKVDFLDRMAYNSSSEEFVFYEELTWSID